MSIYSKKVSVGAFLHKGDDFKDGDLVTIASEGKQVEGEFGLQNIFLVKTASKEGNVSFNRTSINALIDAYGEDSKNWIGKQAKVWGIMSNVQGKMIKVYYFTHPQADVNENGSFTVPVSAKTEPVKDEIKPEDIPF